MIERYESITHYRIDDDYAFTDIMLCDRKYHHEQRTSLLQSSTAQK